jgi:protein-S-isoprenylcysteine O-methyltransferase Ste14/uncharacterized membrane protein (UPF0127 family)
LTGAEPQTRALRDGESGALLVGRLRAATTHWSRLKGLLGTRGLEADEGLWIVPCRQVHMIGMRYPLDVVFLDDGYRVVSTEPGLRPNRISRNVRTARSVVELPAGAIERLGIKEGARLLVEPDLPAADRSRLARVGSALCNLSLAMLFAVFLAAHLTRVLEPGHGARIVPLVVLETIVVVLFLVRRPVRTRSTRWADWAAGTAGTFLPLMLRPHGAAEFLVPLGQALEIVGATIAVVAVTFLGRSFGIVAANRGVKTSGAYRAVRHPMYGAYLLTYVGYVLSYPSVVNVCLAGTTVALQVMRAGMEERVLSEDPAYREYVRRTPWRFIPYVY